MTARHTLADLFREVVQPAPTLREHAARIRASLTPKERALLDNRFGPKESTMPDDSPLLEGQFHVESVPDDCIRFWPREEAPAWVFELVGAEDGPTRGFVGYIPARFVLGVPMLAAFPHGRFDETGDGGYVVQVPFWPVVQFAV